MKLFRYLLILLVCYFIPGYLSAQNGVVKTYFDDGSIESELTYINDILDGISTFYYQNGNLREEIPFSLGKVYGLERKYFPNGLVKEERNFRDGILDGLSKIYHDNGAIKQALNYDNGKLIKKIIVPYDSSFVPPLELYLAGNRQYKLSKDANIVSDVEICPVPVNGIKEIQNNLVYPEGQGLNSLEGMVTLSVKIDTSGNAGATEIVKSLNKEYDLAAINAVKRTKFLPGKNGNKIVESKIIINVEFKNESKTALLQVNEQKAKELLIPLERKTETMPKKEEILIPVSKVDEKSKLVKKDEVKKEENSNAVVTSAKDLEEPKEDTPFPIGGIERILARMRVPQKTIEQRIEGIVIYKVNVDKYGVVRDTKLVQGLGTGIDEVVEIAILESPFKVAKIDGKPTNGEVLLKIPISYKK